MTTNNTYHWKILNLNKSYSSEELNITQRFNVEALDFNFIKPYFTIGHSFIDSFLKQHNEFNIGIKQIKFIDRLLEEYDLLNYKKEFYAFSAIIQNEYLNYFNEPADFKTPLLTDFQNEAKDLEILFNVLKLNLNEENQKMNSINFEFEKANKVKNFFVIKNILNRLSESYGLTIENFEKIKNQEIEKTNRHKLILFDEFTKWKICNVLYNFIRSYKSNSDLVDYNLKFVGYMLAISQIPIKKTDFEISDSTNLNDLIDGDSIKYLNIFIKRPKKYFI